MTAIADLLRTISTSREVTDLAEAIVLRRDSISVVFSVYDSKGRRRRREIFATAEEESAFRQGAGLPSRATTLINATYARATAGL
jgi:tRNA U34 5-methylaminomethyl-2-thiouridine-forming methyltransferase MnmC